MPEGGFANTVTIDGTTGVTFGIIENFHFSIIRNVGATVIVSFHDLAIDHIERRQDGEDRKFSIHAVHTKIVCGNYGCDRNCRWRQVAVCVIVSTAPTSATIACRKKNTGYNYGQK